MVRRRIKPKLWLLYKCISYKQMSTPENHYCSLCEKGMFRADRSKLKIGAFLWWSVAQTINRFYLYFILFALIMAE